MTTRYRALLALRKNLTFNAVIWVVTLSALQVGAQQTQDACERLPKIAVPEQDRPTLAEAYSANVPIPKAERFAVPPGEPQPTTFCDPVGLYYSHSQGHFEKARYCVLTQLGLLRGAVDPAKVKMAQWAASGGATDPEMIDDSSGLVLAMVFANGEGVARNLPLARQFLCQYGGGIQGDGPAQLLANFDKIMKRGEHFDVCAGGGGEFGREVSFVCLGLEQDRRAEEIHRLETAIAAASVPQMRDSFLALVSAWEKFHKAYGAMDSAICDGGTGCGGITEDDDLKMTASWLAALKSLENNVPPASGADPSTFAQLDNRLNSAYRESLDESKGCAPPDCFAAQIRAADRAWLEYREAWVKYGALRWPALPANQWRAWQTAIWIPLLEGTTS